MGRMFNPPHPGVTIREDILPALGLSVSEAAEQLGVSRVSFSRVINGKAAISPIMARRLEAWLNGPKRGPSAESWLRGQLAYDLWQAEQAPAPQVQAASNSRNMRKAEAVSIFGSVTNVATAVGVSTQAVSQWPDPLPPRIADRVLAAIARRHSSPTL
jgi:antitoxin HigA-1